jgi:phosphoserine phosphatase
VNLFLTGSEVLAMALHTLAEHLSERFGGTATRHSTRSAKIDVTGIAAERLAELHAEVEQSASDLRFDFAFVKEHQRWDGFSVLASDMDSTLITIECIDEIADLCGMKAEVSAITEAAMRGEISDFSESLTRRVALLAGAPESVLQTVYHERLRLTPGANALIGAAKAHRLSTLLVSGGFTFFTDRLKARLGIDAAFSNALAIRAGKLTGQIEGPVFGAADKRDALIDLCRSLDVPTSRAIAIGDGANDLPMMAAAGLSVAFHAKPKVVAAADVAIRHGGLDVLLEWL